MIDRRLIGLASDPKRRDALRLLNEQSANVGEVAAALGIEPAAATHLLEQMRDGELIEVVGESLDQGSAEPRYRAAVRVLWEEDEWAELDREEQRRMVAWIIGMVESDIREAIESGTFWGRPDSHVSRSVPVVDEQGWEELRRIHANALDAIFAVEAASAERLAERGEAGFRVLSAIFCGELPPRSPSSRSPS